MHNALKLITLLILFNACSPLCAMDIWEACENNNTQRVELLIEQDNTLVNASSLSSSTPLHCASSNGSLKTAALLLQHKANVDAQGYFKWTPLHKASYFGRTKTAALLLQHNANVNAQNNLKCTPLHYASWNGHLKTAALLLQHNADVNAQDDDKWTPLNHASYTGCTEGMKLLLSYGATPHKPINLFVEYPHYSQTYAQRYESWICKTFVSRKTIALLLSLIGRQKITDIPLLPKDMRNLIADYAISDQEREREESSQNRNYIDPVREWEQFKKENPDVAELARIELP